jgi:curved DNA-binding protein CbpA
LPSFTTHYDILKVSRDAPIEVIQAAYRSLARKYHPDRHGSSPDREAQMKAINAAYEVLSDPAKRAEHDRWIAQHLDRRSPRGAPASHSGSRNPREAAHDRRAANIQQTILTIVLSFCYFSTALWMLRNPGLRYVGIIMLLAGLFYFRPSARR